MSDALGMSEEMIEAVARAICAEYGDVYDDQPADIPTLREWRAREGAKDADGVGIVRSYDSGLPTQKDWQDMARAAIAAHEVALSAAGLVIVPREPTEEMTRNAKRLMDHPRFNHYDAAFVWRAMVDAFKPLCEK